MSGYSFLNEINVPHIAPSLQQLNTNCKSGGPLLADQWQTQTRSFFTPAAELFKSGGPLGRFQLFLPDRHDGPAPLWESWGNWKIPKSAGQVSSRDRKRGVKTLEKCCVETVIFDSGMWHWYFNRMREAGASQCDTVSCITSCLYYWNHSFKIGQKVPVLVWCEQGVWCQTVWTPEIVAVIKL